MHRYIDHTKLNAGTTWNDVKKICDEAKQHCFVAICIPACYVKNAKEYLKGSKVEIATVIGFPLGHMSKKSKVYECQQALKDGADEIDMVINVGYLKSGQYQQVEDEIREVKKACGTHFLKVIVETCYLTEEEIRKVTTIVERGGADFIKTSTGFGTRGASLRDVELFREMSQKLRIKASGGVRDNDAAQKYIKLGATRIGTSSGVQIVTGAKAANP